jgi:hypothetical protein
VTADSQLTWSSHVNQVRKNAAQRLGVLVPLLNRRSGLSVTNGVLLYKQLICPMMDYACPIWWSAARSHVRKLQVLQSKCLRIATNAPWYVSNRQIHEYLGIPFFADYTRVLTESFDSKLADAGNPLVRQLRRHLCRARADWSHPRVTEVDWCSSVQSRMSIKCQPSRCNDLSPTTRQSWLRFSVLFPVVRQIQRYNLKGSRPAFPSTRGLQLKWFHRSRRGH